MGPGYELREWLGKYYIVYSDASTEWQETAYEITPIQYLELEALNDKQMDETNILMISMIKGN